jgi:NADPH:quinone reductase-like Zn-dependent oxidoreductase
VVDYTKEDFTKGERRYDIIFDNMGNRRFGELKRVLTSTGSIVPNSGHGGMSYVFKAFLLKPFSSKIAGMYMAKPNTKDFDFLQKLIEAGKITPIIDRTYTFEEIPQAVAYVGEGHAHGKVVVTIKDQKS